MKKFFFPLFTFMLIITACTDTKKEILASKTKEAPVVAKEVIAPVAIVDTTTATIEKLPVALATKIFNECNNLDVTFYNSDNTINLWDDNVKHVLSMITAEAPAKLDNNIMGHIMMVANGEQLAFAEISLKGTNNYVIYTIDNKKYYNKINEKGLEFFTRF